MTVKSTTDLHSEACPVHLMETIFGFVRLRVRYEMCFRYDTAQGKVGIGLLGLAVPTEVGKLQNTSVF